MLGGDDVGPVQQQIGRQAGGQLADFELAAQGQGGRQVVGDFLADEQFDLVARQLGIFNSFGIAGLGSGDGGFLFAQIQSGNHARAVTQLRQAVGFLTGFEHALRQIRAGQCVLLVEIGFGDGGYQAQMGAVAAGGGGEVALQRGFAAVAHASPQVQFEGGNAQAHREAVAHALRVAAACGACRAVERGQFCTAGDGVLGADLLHVQIGGAQVGVVFQRQLNQSV